MSTPQIAAAVGVGGTTVRRYSPPPRSSVDSDLVHRMRDEGKPISEIARVVGRSRRTVERLLAGRSRGSRVYHAPYPQSVRDKARAMLEERAGYAEVARTLGVYEKTVASWFPGMGLTPEEAAERRAIMQKYGGVL